MPSHEANHKPKLFGLPQLGAMISISTVAAVVSAGTAALGLQVWMMFLGWIMWATNGPSLRTQVAATICFIGGAVLGLAAAMLNTSLVSLGPGSLPVAVFVATMLALSTRSIPPFSIVPAYYIGIAGFFAAGASVNPSSLANESIAGMIGAAGCYLATIASSALEQRLNDMAAR